MPEEFKILKTTPLADSEIEIDGEISAEVIDRYRKKALENLNERIKIDGFRAGHIPEKVLTDKVGELAVLEEAASIALENSYLKILESGKINPVGRPQVSITKLATNNPLGFKIKVAIVPEVKLPDYKKLAKEVMSKNEKIEVTDQEFEETLNQIRKGQLGQTAGADSPLPELTDEMVRKFGDYKNVEDFKTKLRQNILLDKELREREKRRLETIDQIIQKTKVDVPKILIESEKEKMISQFKGNIEGMGLKSEDYFKQIGKTEDQVKSEWNDEAIKRSKMELILQKIALEEKIEPAKEEIEKETAHILSHHKDADPFRARIYVEQILTNEKVWQFLESQK